MRKRALILDHDDTVVASSAAIHYPSFVQTLQILRPNISPCTFEEFTSMCFHHGFLGLCQEIYQFDDAEMEVEYQIWKKNTAKVIPPFYPQMKHVLTTFKEQGGYIAVVSHSESTEISRDYLAHLGFVPDKIYGFDQLEHQRKPNSFPILDFMELFNLKPEEMLVVDDMKDGLMMAKSCQVEFAAAGWSMILQDMIDYFTVEADYFLKQPHELWDIIKKDLSVY